MKHILLCLFLAGSVFAQEWNANTAPQINDREGDSLKRSNKILNDSRFNLNPLSVVFLETPLLFQAGPSEWNGGTAPQISDTPIFLLRRINKVLNDSRSGAFPLSITGGSTFDPAAPGPIGGTTPGSGAFTTLSASSTVSGAGFTERFAAPGPIGNTTPSTGAFTTLTTSGTSRFQFNSRSTLNDATQGMVIWSQKTFADEADVNVDGSVMVKHQKTYIGTPGYAGTTQVYSLAGDGPGGMIIGNNNFVGATVPYVPDGASVANGFIRFELGPLWPRSEKMRLNNSGDLIIGWTLETAFTASQTGTTVTATVGTFTAGMVGKFFLWTGKESFADRIITLTDGTHVEVETTRTITSQSGTTAVPKQLIDINGRFEKDILPSVSGTTDLGNATYKWRAIHADAGINAGAADYFGWGVNKSVFGSPSDGVIRLANYALNSDAALIYKLRATSAAAPTIASAGTIAPTTPIVFVSGTTTIETITAPAPISAGGGSITIIPTGIFATGVTGNIALASTSVVSKALIMTYDATTTKWYPSY